MTNYTPAGFVRRFAAVLIDCVLFFLFVTIPVSLTLGSVSIATGNELNWMNVTIGYAIPFVLTMWFWQKYLGTPGKMLIGIQIVDNETGRKPGMLKLVVRYVAYLVSIGLFMLGFIWIIFDKRKRGFHDYLSGTAVIKTVPEYIDRY